MSSNLLSGRRTLVVEDEMLVVILIEDMLADLGCESVTVAATIKRALSVIESQIFDVAMLDMNLNGHQTYPVADALAARGVPFVFATGYTGHEIRDGYRDRPVLRKPFSDEGLREVLSVVLTGD